jgi:hypothetical protein
MPKKSKARLKPALRCELCEGSLKLKKVIPAAHIFPELRTYGCVECGALRSVEDEAELLTPRVSLAKVAKQRLRVLMGTQQNSNLRDYQF